MLDYVRQLLKDTTLIRKSKNVKNFYGEAAMA
jgi:hypothetical protein